VSPGPALPAAKPGHMLLAKQWSLFDFLRLRNP